MCVCEGEDKERMITLALTHPPYQWGFKQSMGCFAEANNEIIVIGKWGCGAFSGDLHLNFCNNYALQAFMLIRSNGRTILLVATINL
jgi:hypothetical protein